MFYQIGLCLPKNFVGVKLFCLLLFLLSPFLDFLESALKLEDSLLAIFQVSNGLPSGLLLGVSDPLDQIVGGSVESASF